MGGPGAGGFFFFILLHYFINVMIKTLYISSVIVVFIRYFTHIDIVHVDMFFPSAEKLTFGSWKSIFSNSFSHTRLKHTSFCSEFNCVYSKTAPKKLFSISFSFQKKITQNLNNCVKT